MRFLGDRNCRRPALRLALFHQVLPRFSEASRINFNTAATVALTVCPVVPGHFGQTCGSVLGIIRVPSRMAAAVYLDLRFHVVWFVVRLRECVCEAGCERRGRGAAISPME